MLRFRSVVVHTAWIAGLVGTPTIFADGSCLSPQIEIVDFGIYEDRTSEEIEAEVAKTGEFTLASVRKLIESSDRIPGTLGTEFGFRYRLDCENDIEEVPVTLEAIHPKMTNPESAEVSEATRWSEDAQVGDTNYHSGWLFEKDWEIVLGAWSIRVIHNEEVLAEKHFTVVAE